MSREPEHVAIVDVWNQGRSGEFRTAHGIDELPHGTKLYLHPPQPQVPDGYVLVPVEPTESAVDAGVKLAMSVSIHGKGSWNNYIKALYKAMLTASQEKP